MSDKPEALRLADALDRQFLHDCEPAAAFLRRQHAEIERLLAIVQDYPPIEIELREVSDRLFAAEAERDELKMLLTSLTALVRGECPRLLNEDCDGDGRLSIAIDAAIDAAREAK